MRRCPLWIAFAHVLSTACDEERASTDDGALPDAVVMDASPDTGGCGCIGDGHRWVVIWDDSDDDRGMASSGVHI